MCSHQARAPHAAYPPAHQQPPYPAQPQRGQQFPDPYPPKPYPAQPQGLYPGHPLQGHPPPQRVYPQQPPHGPYPAQPQGVYPPNSQNNALPKDSGRSAASERALQKQVEQLRREVTDIRKQLEESRRRERLSFAKPNAKATPPADAQKGNFDQSRVELNNLRRENFHLKSRIQMLEEQMATYKEDFQIERFDRERTQAELHASKEERESLKQAIQMLATEHGVLLDPGGQPLPPQRNHH